MPRLLVKTLAVTPGGAPGRQTRGSDVAVYLVKDDGSQHVLPVKALKLRCEGRGTPVSLELLFDQVDLELDIVGALHAADAEERLRT